MYYIPFVVTLAVVVGLVVAALLSTALRSVVTLGFVVCAGVLSAALEVLLVPLYIGSTPIPVSVVFAVVGNVALVRLARTVVSSSRLVVLPVVGWMVVILAASVSTDEGDVLLPAGPSQWISYGLLFGGAIAGLVAAMRAQYAGQAG